MRTREQEIERCVEVGKQEIRSMVYDGKVPASVKSLDEMIQFTAPEELSHLADVDRIQDLYSVDDAVDMMAEISIALNRWIARQGGQIR